MNSELGILTPSPLVFVRLVPVETFPQMSGERKFGSSPLDAWQNQTATILKIIPLRFFSKP